MMNSIKTIAVLIDVYSSYGGASKAALYYAALIKKYGYQSYVICNNKLSNEVVPQDVYLLDSVTKIQNFLLEKGIEVLHYFKAEKNLYRRSVYRNAIKAIRNTGKDIRVLTTVCQQPSYGRAILTPFEISNSDYILFIDKTAYNDPMFYFIPEDRKSWFYLTAAKDMIHNAGVDKYAKKNYEINNNTILFGRGSTLNKCPKDMIDLYDQIKILHKKKFVVVGIPEEDNWLSKKLKKRGGEDIQTLPIQLQDKYAEIISSFDIVLYYLPKNAYSSRDGSLREAMRLGIPVVVYGPSAVKEAVTHGVDGYVAESKEDFVKYAEKLANDSELRRIMGSNARRLYFENAPVTHWSKAYTCIIEKICHEPKQESIKCPFFDMLKIYFIRDISWLTSLILKTYSRSKKFF